MKLKAFIKIVNVLKSEPSIVRPLRLALIGGTLALVLILVLISWAGYSAARHALTVLSGVPIAEQLSVEQIDRPDPNQLVGQFEQAWSRVFDRSEQCLRSVLSLFESKAKSGWLSEVNDVQSALGFLVSIPNHCLQGQPPGCREEGCLDEDKMESDSQQANKRGEII